MAKKEDIFSVLSAASAPMSRTEIGDKVGEPYRKFQTQLDRWVKQELLSVDEEHNYTLTDKGREEAANGFAGEGQDDMQTGISPDESEATQRTVGTTEYQQFYRLGENVGVVPKTLIKVTTEHVWNGGDYKNLNWVAQALQDMGIQRDLATRWFHSWSSHLKMPIPVDVPMDFKSPDVRKAQEKEESEKKQTDEVRDYILDNEGMPVKVGPGLGYYTYKDAMELSKLKLARGESKNQPEKQVSSVEEVIKLYNAFKDMMGEKSAGKSYVVKQTEEGIVVDEVDPGKPLVIPQNGGSKPSPSYLVDQNGEVKEITPGQPVVITRNNPVQASPSVQYLVDQRTGTVQEVAAGQPIVVKMEAPPSNTGTPIQVKDKDGNPMILDINTYIRLEEHKEKQRRDEESHEIRLDIAKGFKDLLKSAQVALMHMGDEDE